MKRRICLIVTTALMCALAAGCGKKKDKPAGGTEGGGSAAAGGAGAGGEMKVPANLAGYQALPDYKRLMAVADEGLAANTAKKCDDVIAKGKEAIALLLRLVPGYGAIGEGAENDEALGNRMGDLNAVRATLEMSTEGYERDAKEHAADGGPGMDMREHYCSAVAEDFAKLKQ